MAWGQLDRPQIRDFKVAIDGDVPATLHDQIAVLDAQKQIQLVGLTADCSAVVHYFPSAKEVGIYSPEALPSVEGPSPEVAQLYNRPLVKYAGAADGERVASELLYVARVQRLMTLENPAGPRLVVKLNKVGSSAGPPSMTGVVAGHLVEGDHFTLSVKNESQSTRLYAAVFCVDATGKVDLLYPKESETPHEIAAGAEFEIGKDFPFEATYDPNARDGIDRTRLKLVATDTFVDYSQLVSSDPTPGAATVRGLSRTRPGANTAYWDLMRDVLNGGQLVRDLQRGANRFLPSQWAAANVDFDVTKVGR